MVLIALIACVAGASPYAVAEPVLTAILGDCYEHECPDEPGNFACVTCVGGLLGEPEDAPPEEIAAPAEGTR